MLENQQSLTTLAKGLENINQGNNAILELAQQAAQQIGQGGGSLREIEYANQLAVLSQRIAKNANALASSEEIDPEVAFLLGKDAGTFRDILNGLLKGSDALRLPGVRNEEARATLTELQKRFAAYDAGRRRDPAEHEPAGRGEAGGARHQQRVGGAARTTRRSSPTQFEAGGRTRGRAVGGRRVRRAGARVPACCSARCSSTTRASARSRASGENKRNQEAILRLLNEMGNLADGDLTVQASVTEDVTGAIADSINFTIEELRTLVKGINSATDQVAKATQDAQAISNRLYEASQRQNKEIQQASSSVLQMAQSISEVSQSAVAVGARGAAVAGRRGEGRRRRCRTRSPA